MGSHTIPAVADIGEGHILILPYKYSAINQGTWAMVVSAACILNFYWRNSPPANLDECDYQAYLAAGTYTLRLLAYDLDNAGIVDIDIDGVEVASFDLYDAGNPPNQIYTQTAIVVATSGLKTITVRVDGKNGASGGYYGTWQSLCFWRTA